MEIVLTRSDAEWLEHVTTWQERLQARGGIELGFSSATLLLTSLQVLCKKRGYQNFSAQHLLRVLHHLSVARKRLEALRFDAEDMANHPDGPGVLWLLIVSQLLEQRRWPL